MSGKARAFWLDEHGQPLDKSTPHREIRGPRAAVLVDGVWVQAQPCPWCGTTATRLLEQATPSVCVVQCQGCRSCGPVAETRVQALALWNGRGRYEP